MKTLKNAMAGENTSHILPFLWMRGEDNEAIGKELDKIEECGIREVCLESRPHPDFAGPLWWKNLDYILAQARRRRMRVWVLDDDKFPTGHCNGALEEKHPELAKTYLAERHMDIYGPCRCNAVLMENFLWPDGELLGVLACPKPDGETLAVSKKGIIDLTGHIRNGFVYFDLPEGPYRLFVLFRTKTGGGRPGYVNLIDSRSVRVLIDEVYEKHYEHYKDYFGKEFAGFFSDEPELGNVPGYPFDCALGQKDTKLPWSGELEEALRGKWGDDFLPNLVALWYPQGEDTESLRYTYMDEMTKLVRRCFSGQIGIWCAAHQVEYIGHVLEDANSHNKIGCGAGHYFREMEGQHMSGVDVVHHQIVPGFTEKYHQWIAGDTDGEFFHFGLAKMGSSAAHIDPNKKNRALCEIFGNYGWAEGLPLMKWLTDHMLVRGINEFTPHAFSMRYPDRDCPPHFYAQGQNPQFEGFAQLMKYMNRVASILSVGRHQAQAAVLYHGDMEWADPEAMLFQKPVRALMEYQLDCDVVPCDVFADGRAELQGGKLVINGNEYPCIVVPGCRYLPGKAAEFLVKAAGAGVPVYIIVKNGRAAGGPLPEDLPAACAEGGPLPEGFPVACAEGSPLPEGCPVARAESGPLPEGFPVACAEGGPLPEGFAGAVRAVSLKELPALVAAHAPLPVRFSRHDPGLRVFCAQQSDGLVCMLFNENVSRTVRTKVKLCGANEFAIYDAWADQAWRLTATGPAPSDGSVPSPTATGPAPSDGSVPGPTATGPAPSDDTDGAWITLLPGESVLLFAGEDLGGIQPALELCSETPLSCTWRISRRHWGEADFTPYCTAGSVQGLPNLNGPDYDPSFVGTYAYEGSLELEPEDGARYILKMPEASDCARISVNGADAATLISFPSRADITKYMKKGKNELRVEVTTTLVWERKDGASTHLQIPASGMTAQPILEVWK